MCIGGDRTSGYLHAKEQLFRTLDDVNPDTRLAALEASIMAEVNNLEIGTMGCDQRPAGPVEPFARNTRPATPKGSRRFDLGSRRDQMGCFSRT